MKQILFNSGSTYTKAGDKMNVLQLSDIDVVNTKKEDLPWLQMFNSGYRVNKANIDWNTWNGCIYSDIDSKHYYNDVRKFNTENLKQSLYNYLYYTYDNIFYCMQLSNSGTGYHILFYFDVEKSELNFKKCSQYVMDVVKEAFSAIGAGDIINYKKVADRCSTSPYQGMYLTNNELIFGNTNDRFFGNFEDIDNIELVDSKLLQVSDIKNDGTKLFKLDSFKEVKHKVEYKEHHQRWSIYDSLIAVFGDKDKVDYEWEHNICPKLPEANGHGIKFYISEPDSNDWYNIYTPEYVKVNRLNEFGYEFSMLFEPKVVNMYEPDVEYTLTDNQRISDIDIKWSKDKINHLFAGCGFGKTYNVKELGRDDLISDIDYAFGARKNKVCFISPMKSINKDSFENLQGNWIIIDGDHKEDNIEKYNNIKEKISYSDINVCTTWESFCMYEMSKIDFDYVIVDEVHTFFMYDYRVNSITNIKKELKKAKGIKIIMTGTPSAEVHEFDCYKIKINKKTHEVPAEIIFYNKQFRGYYMNDIKEWTEDKNHYAVIFNDITNNKTESTFNAYGIDCDIFNTNYKDNVEYILNNNTIKNQVTAFSVYGQAGINLYIDTDHKIRIYILNKNGLGIIQYANRIRNKEVIDKVVLGYKISDINNDINKLNFNIDYADGERRVNMINSIQKPFDIFETKTQDIIKLRFGLTYDCLNKIGETFELNKDNYATYSMIKNVEDYEKQIQVIYNRLIQNSFSVSCKYLDEDIKDCINTKMRSNQLAGQLVRIDLDSMLIEKKESGFWFKPSDEFLKVCTGDLADNIEYILNSFYNETGSKEASIDKFKLFVNEVIKKTGSIHKSDITNCRMMLNLKKNWETYYNAAFIKAMLLESYDVMKLTALYTRSIYNNTIDWKIACDESYEKINKLKKVVEYYSEVFEELSTPDSLSIPNDDTTKMLYTYIVKQHTRGKSSKRTGKAVIINGIQYNSAKEAAEKLNKSLAWISKYRDK